MLRAIEATFQAVLEEARTRHDENLRSMEAKIDELEGKLKDKESTHLVKAKPSTCFRQCDERLLTMQNQLEVKSRRLQAGVKSRK